MKTHIVLVPGFWLGSWAWDAVLPHLERSDTRVTSLTLPGLDAVDTDRSAVTFDAHVRAVVDAVSDSDERTVLVVHSGAGPVGYAVTDRIPDRVARIVYVDSGPMPDGAALRPDLASDVIEIPLPTWAELEADGSSLEGLDEKALETFRANAVPEPAGPAREPIVLTNRKALPGAVNRRLQHLPLRGDRPDGRRRSSDGRRTGETPRDVRRPPDRPLADVVAP